MTRTPSQTEPRILKKYPNRRLYDTHRSSYITIDDVRKLVLEGVPFKVIDAHSEADITRSILVQIITEDESGKEATFTTDMLARFIRLSHDAAQSTFAVYLDRSMQLFLEQQKQIGEGVKAALSGQALPEITQRTLELWETIRQSFLNAAGLGATSSKAADQGGKPPK